MGSSEDSVIFRLMSNRRNLGITADLLPKQYIAYAYDLLQIRQPNVEDMAVRRIAANELPFQGTRLHLLRLLGLQNSLFVHVRSATLRPEVLNVWLAVLPSHEFVERLARAFVAVIRGGWQQVDDSNCRLGCIYSSS